MKDFTNSSAAAGELFPYHIFLIGFMGTGKSTVAEALQNHMGVERIEMDCQISQQAGMPITEIFDRYGEACFRDLESAAFRQLQSPDQGNAVVSCGGGAVIREQNVESMKKSGRIVLLTASPETVYQRVKDSTARPILNQNMSEDYIGSLMEARRPLYEHAADLIVSTDHKSIAHICQEIISGLQALDRQELRIPRSLK